MKGRLVTQARKGQKGSLEVLDFQESLVWMVLQDHKVLEVQWV